MAQVVDTKGKVKAAPSGKLMDGDKAQKSTSKEAVNTIVDDAVKSVVNAVSNVKIKSSAPSVSKKNSLQNKNSVHKQNSSSNAPNTLSSPYTGISGGIPVVRNQSSGLSSTTPSMIASTQEPSSFDESEIPFSEKPTKDNPYNEIYEKDMLDSGMSQDYLDRYIKESGDKPFSAKDYLDWDINALKDPQAASDELLASVDDYYMLDPDLLLDDTKIDDGTIDRPHLLSDWMTGKQYYHYVHDLGLPGMPEDQIDISDNGRYSKTSERQMNGFQPYIPNSTYGLGMTIPNIASSVRNFSNYIKNLRPNGFLNDVDYQITTDTGYGVNSFSGRDFDKMSNGYTSQVNDLYDRAYEGDPEAMSILMNEENHSSPYTTMVRERELPDGSKHYGVVTGMSRVNDLVDEDVFNDFVLWDVDENTEATPPDENGISTYGNMTFNLDDNRNILSGTLQTKDGFTLNLAPTSDGGYQIVDDDAYDRWIESHDNGDIQISFSDGSSAIVQSEDIDEAIKNNPKDNWIGNKLVPYNGTSLKDIENFNPESLTVGNPTSLSDHFDFENGSGSEAGAIYVPDMILSDGTPISQDTVLKIANDDNPDDWMDDGIRYHFEPSGLSSRRLPFPLSIAAGTINPFLVPTDSRPRRLMHDEIIDEDGPHLGLVETPDWLADASANSIPISLPIYQWVDSLANTLPYIAGVESGSGDEYGRYQTTGYEPGSEENTIKAISTLFGPALENLAGYGHEPFLDPFVEKLIGKKFADGSLSNILLSKLWDSTGEAAEEVFGNYVDEPSVYGFKNAWANRIDYPYAGMGKVYDKDHNLLYEVDNDVSEEDLSNIYNDMIENYGDNGQFPILYDEHGREFRDPNTPIGNRFSNAFALTPEHLDETANAAFGGAGVSWLYSMPEIMYGLGSALRHPKQRQENPNFSKEWNIGTDSENPSDEIYVPESVKSDRILTNDYRINPGAPIRFKE